MRVRNSSWIFSSVEPEDIEDAAEQFLANTYTVEGMVPAVVIEAGKQGIVAYMQGGKRSTLKLGGHGHCAQRNRQ